MPPLLFHAGKAQSISVTSNQLSQALQMGSPVHVCAEYRCLVHEGRQAGRETAPRKGRKCSNRKGARDTSREARAEKGMPLEHILRQSI